MLCFYTQSNRSRYRGYQTYRSWHKQPDVVDNDAFGAVDKDVVASRAIALAVSSRSSFLLLVVLWLM